MADCVTILTMVLHSQAEITDALKDKGVVAACVQAFETEHAARIQAAAARQTGIMTMVAGIGVLGAAAVTYAAAVRALRAEEMEKAAAVTSYRRHLALELQSFERELRNYIHVFDVNEKLIFTIFPMEQMLEKSMRLFERLKPNNYEEFAKLGNLISEFVGVYYALNSILREWKAARETLTDSRISDLDWTKEAEKCLLKLETETEKTREILASAGRKTYPRNLSGDRTSDRFSSFVSNVVRVIFRTG